MDFVERVLRARGPLRTLVDDYERPLKAFNSVSLSAKDSLRDFVVVVENRQFWIDVQCFIDLL